MPSHAFFGLAAAIAFAPLAGGAAAKSARCFTTDDGEYPCAFTATAADGSFEISAPGKPMMSLVMNGDGTAAGFANFGDRNVALPGTYRRDPGDPACWVNDSTDTKICAW